MKPYPQTPIEFVQQAVEEAKRRGAVAAMVDPAVGLVENGSWQQARELVDLAVRRTPDACSNLRSKLSWASQWAEGRLPGTMQADLDNHQYSADDVRDAWLEVISGGKYEPPQPTAAAPPEEIVVRVDEPDEVGDNKDSAAPPPPKGVEIKEGDDYADIQDAINKGIL